MSEKLVECFQHIAKHWPEEYYKKCYEQWKNIELFIVKYSPTIGYECSCGTKWTNLKFINRIDNICPACDDWCQPFLSNPKNRENVIKYIPEEYQKYIFSDLKYLRELFHQYDEKADFFEYLGGIDLGKNCIIYKEKGASWTYINIYSTAMSCKIYSILYDNRGNISTFIKYNNVKGILKESVGMYEYIYSNRSEFYINGKYYSTGYNDYIMKTIEKITYLIMIQKIVPTLYNFIKGNEDFDLILLDQLDNCEKIIEQIK